jgi:hypothetical protein
MRERGLELERRVACVVPEMVRGGAEAIAGQNDGGLSFSRRQCSPSVGEPNAADKRNHSGAGFGRR